ncbi:platelet-activating factor acetylhydrolase, isoform II-domain-containing protein [Thelonectria olida]|uniref:Putative phospholipase n=1 Tax=Thelonectria olida TaxID=1576542 RepID=A0A9P8VZ59_9HYPO|nr:platelet-activating factor acetylhydrolase, isoform II-domain-containing protein [Thelonectria olida]
MDSSAIGDDYDEDDGSSLYLSDPDLPLTSHPALLHQDSSSTRVPRWLLDRNRRWTSWPCCVAASRIFESALFKAIASRLKRLLRPRLTLRYIFFFLIVVYVVYCFLTWQPFFSSALPPYSGPHDVGAIDIEFPLEKPIKISDTILRDTREPAFKVETVLFTIYYPATKTSRSKMSRHPWIPRPISLTAEGYARIAGVDNFIVRPIFTFALWLVVGGVSIPAKVDVPILGRDHDHVGKFPVMVFSHGMASSRTDYTHYLGELASRGYVVAAIEHRDGSCPGTMIKIKDKKDKRVLLMRESDLESDPPMTTEKLKKEQLAFRDAEIYETIRVLWLINNGEGFDDVFLLNSRNEGHALTAWTERMDFQQLTISGHSYGATGALQALKTANKTVSNPAIGGIILDPGKSSGQLNTDVPVPVLVVHSQEWSRYHSIFFGRPHFDTVRDLVRGVLTKVGSAWFLTSLGTAHPSVTDAPLLQPLLLRLVTGTTMPALEALGEYVKVSIDFLKFLDLGKAQGVLHEAVTHNNYHKWVTDERKKEFPEDRAKHWEVHVSPQRSI